MSGFAFRSLSHRGAKTPIRAKRAIPARKLISSRQRTLLCHDPDTCGCGYNNVVGLYKAAVVGVLLTHTSATRDSDTCNPNEIISASSVLDVYGLLQEEQYIAKTRSSQLRAHTIFKFRTEKDVRSGPFGMNQLFPIHPSILKDRQLDVGCWVVESVRLVACGLYAV